MVMEVIVSVTLLFAGMAVLVTIHICIVGRAFQNGFNSGAIVSIHRGGDFSPNMSQDEIKKLPCFQYKVEEKGNNCCIECAVCLESFKLGDLCRLLPNCRHCFHAQCIDSWLRKTAICPICRNNVNSKKKVVESSSSSSEIAVELV